jgi:ubiquinone/menaquinone biosynthesis C-methylase UbiE
MERQLEPEVMDTPEEALAYDAMDHTEVNRIFVDDLLMAFADSGRQPEGDFLDLGTGTALIPIELCGRTDEARVMGVDLSVHMLDVARNNIEIAGLRDRIQLDKVDSKRLPYEDGSFAVVMSNSIVHHIPEPEAVLREAWRVLAPGGLLFFRDLLRPADSETVTKLVDAYAGDATEHQRKMFDDSLRAALSLGEIQELVARLGLPSADVRQTSDRHWTWLVWKNAAA